MRVKKIRKSKYFRYTISIPIFKQGNPSPSTEMRQYSFKLHEHPNFGWSPRLSHGQFVDLLSDVVSIRLRATYAKQGIGVLDDVELESAAYRVGSEPATHVEKCRCPEVSRSCVRTCVRTCVR